MNEDDKPSAQAPTGLAMHLDWSSANDVPIQPANTFWIQSFGSEIILSIGHALPPAETAGMSGPDVRKYIVENEVKVQRIVRLLISPAHAAALASMLQE